MTQDSRHLSSEGDSKSGNAGQGPYPRQHLNAGTSPPRLPLNWWGLGVRFVIAVATLLSLNILAPLIVTPLMVLFESSESAPYILQFLRYAVVLVGTVGLVALWMRWIERKALRDAGWVISRRGFGWLTAGVGMSVATFGLLLMLDLVVGTSIFEASDAYSESIRSVPWWAVLLIWFGMAFLLQGIPEELLWRGWLFTIVRDRPWLAFWWTTLTFTAIHLISDGGQEQWYGYLSYLMIPLGFGALAGALVLTTGSLWIAAGVHAGFHTGNNLVVLLVGQALGTSSTTHVVVGIAYLIPTARVLLRWNRRWHR